MPGTPDQINQGEEVRIVRIGGRGATRRRLKDMGVTREEDKGDIVLFWKTRMSPYVMGANIAGFVKVADLMIDQGLV